MLLTIAADIPDTDLGYLLHKNPARLHSFDVPFGRAHVFYPECGTNRSEAALLLDVDAIGLVRKDGGEQSLWQYVNDRPYASSSFLSVALSRVFGTALGGRSKERQELADRALPWRATVTALRCGESDLLQRLFEPLGYSIETKHYNLDDQFPEWGAGPYATVQFAATLRLQQLLTHLYVLIPVLDAQKHYWVGDDEVEKLLEKGADWLAAHPERDLIVARYLKHDRRLTNAALTRLLDEEPGTTDAVDEEPVESEPLWKQRMGAVLAALRSKNVQSVVDLGCGEGKLLELLVADRSFSRILGVDVSWRSLEVAARRLKLDRMPDAQRARIQLIHGSLTYRDERLSGFDGAAIVEVIEHLDPARLSAFERVVFEAARPRVAVVTTPNAEYNRLFPSLASGTLRHSDHRFEWTRAEFRSWAQTVAGRFGYSVEFLPIGPADPNAGSPTQMGLFER